MPHIKFDTRQSALVIIDIQPVLSKTVFESDRVLAHSAFIARIAQLLGVPILATEQNPTRMGSTLDGIAPLLAPQSVFAKMSFSAADSPEFVASLRETECNQVVLVGMETHICITQTAHDLQALGYQVAVCPDAVSARSQERHKLGMERLRDSGIVPAHTESVVYEWLRTAEHPLFKQALAIVKEYS